MVIHGTRDNIVPFQHSEQILRALDPECRAIPLFIEGMGHNNVHPLQRPLFVERINAYLDEHVRGQGSLRRRADKRMPMLGGGGGSSQTVSNNMTSLQSLLGSGFVTPPVKQKLLNVPSTVRISEENPTAA